MGYVSNRLLISPAMDLLSFVAENPFEPQFGPSVLAGRAVGLELDTLHSFSFFYFILQDKVACDNVLGLPCAVVDSAEQWRALGSDLRVHTENSGVTIQKWGFSHHGFESRRSKFRYAGPRVTLGRSILVDELTVRNEKVAVLQSYNSPETGNNPMDERTYHYSK
jgi:hypothetical protein